MVTTVEVVTSLPIAPWNKDEPYRTIVTMMPEDGWAQQGKNKAFGIAHCRLFVRLGANYMYYSPASLNMCEKGTYTVGFMFEKATPGSTKNKLKNTLVIA